MPCRCVCACGGILGVRDQNLAAQSSICLEKLRGASQRGLSRSGLSANTAWLGLAGPRNIAKLRVKDSQSGLPPRHDEWMTAESLKNIYVAGTRPAVTEIASTPELFQHPGVRKIRRRQPVHDLPARSAVHPGARPAVWSITSFCLVSQRVSAHSTDLSTGPGSKSSGAVLLQPPVRDFNAG